MHLPRWWVTRLTEPVDIASLVVFRVVFGAIMFWEVIRYFEHGWIYRYWIEPSFHFTYLGFGWVQPWPGAGMYLHFIVLGVLAVCIAAGVAYRLAAALFFVAFSYIFLLDQARYLNHFYLIALVALLLVAVPAHRALSVDAALRPPLRAQTAPAWSLILLRAQLAIVYFYGGIAKLNGDWLRGEPMREWLADRADLPLIGRWFGEEWMVFAFSYGGLAIDLLAVPLLLWRRSRPYMFAVLVAFHLLNVALFSIGIFPWLMIGATTLFFAPDWPRQLVGGWLWRRGRDAPADPAPVSVAPRPLALLLALYLAVQLVLPLRHLLYPGNVSWTEEGHRFAWHMKLRDKDADAQFIAVHADGTHQQVDSRRYLTRRQEPKMERRPDMIVQFAHHLAAELRAEGHRVVAVYVDATASLNGRPPQRLIDPSVNLLEVRDSLAAKPWIVPLAPGVGRAVP